MAKILFTAVVADMRNKLSGSVFSKNRYGSFVRTKVTPVNPQSTAQQNSRNILSTHSQAWRGLTPEQRQGWIDASINFPFTDIFGNVRYLSGNALYVKLNSNLNYAGVASINDAPAPVEIEAITALSLTADASSGAIPVTFAPTPVPADFALLLQLTGNVGPGKQFVKNLFRNVAVVAAAGTTPFAAKIPWANIFGTPIEGQQIFVKATMISTLSGQAGIPLQASTIVVA